MVGSQLVLGWIWPLCTVRCISLDPDPYCPAQTAVGWHHNSNARCSLRPQHLALTSMEGSHALAASRHIVIFSTCPTMMSDA